MKKIPTVFERDWERDPGRVIAQVHPGCEWVLTGEGIATRKLDGTCCMVRYGSLWKRRELKKGAVWPPGFELSDTDLETGKMTGWVPVGDGPEDQWHRAALKNEPAPLADGTYELVGPKVEGNPEGFDDHWLIRHGYAVLNDVPRDFDGLKEWLRGKDLEGIVFHHPDGRMAKIKLRDFGHKREKANKN